MGCRLLRQSTTVTIDMGPALDRADAYTEETGLSPTVYLSKAGAAQAARNSATAITHDARGYYRVEFNTTDTGTLGMLRALFHDSATHLPVWEYFMVIPSNVYDSLVAGSDNLEVDAILWRGTQPNVLQSGRVDGYVGAMAANVLTATAINDGAITAAKLADAAITAAKLADDAITAAKIAADAIGSSELAATAAAEIAAAIRTELTTELARIDAAISSRLASASYTAPDNTGIGDIKAVTDQLADTLEDDGGTYRFTANSLEQAPTGAGGDGSAFTSIPWNPAWDAEVQSEVADALTAYDPPTRAEATADKDEILAAAADIPTVSEFNARTLAAADYATAAEQATADGKLDAIYSEVDTEIEAIITALGAAQTTLDDLSARLPAALVSGRMASDAQAINGSTAAAVRQALAAGTIIVGTVDSTGHTPTTTEFEADDITEATADHYNGRVILFTSGALLGQATSISDYALASGRGHFTVPALTEAPANNVTFIIV